MTKRIFTTLCMFLIVGLISLSAQNIKIDTTYIGPKTGTLVIVGGGSGIDSILNEFMNLAGGKDAPIVFVPTADGGQTIPIMEVFLLVATPKTI